jgi:hypothetical protein
MFWLMACPNCSKISTGQLPIIKDGTCVNAKCHCGTTLLYISNDEKGFFSDTGFDHVQKIVGKSEHEY